MRFFTTLALMAPTLIAADCGNSVTAFFTNNVNLIFFPSNEAIAKVCTGKPHEDIIGTLVDIENECGNEFPPIRDLLTMVRTLLCQQDHEGEYCLNQLLQILPSIAELSKLADDPALLVDMDWTAYLKTHDKYEIACKSKYCVRKILNSTVHVTRELAEISSWDITDEVEFVFKIASAVTASCAPEVCASADMATLLVDGVLQAKACNTNNKPNECGRRIINRLRALDTSDGFVAPSCENEPDPEDPCASLKISLPNVKWEWLQALEGGIVGGIVAGIIEDFINDLTFLVSFSDDGDAILTADNLEAGLVEELVAEVGDNGISINLQIKVCDLGSLSKLFEKFAAILADASDAVPMISWDTFTESAAFNDIDFEDGSITLTNAFFEGIFTSDDPTQHPTVMTAEPTADPTELDEATSGAYVQGGALFSAATVVAACL